MIGTKGWLAHLSPVELERNDDDEPEPRRPEEPAGWSTEPAGCPGRPAGPKPEPEARPANSEPRSGRTTGQSEVVASRPLMQRGPPVAVFFVLERRQASQTID